MRLPRRILSGPAGVALLAGLAAALAHPPFGLLPGLLGYGFLLAAADRAEGDHPRRSAFWRAFLAGLAYFAVGCWWVAEAFFVDAAEQGWMAPFAVMLLAAGLGLFWGVAGLLYRAARPKHPLAKVLVFAGALSLMEWLRGHVLTGFAWNLPGETWKAGSAPSQAAALVGAYGLTWITVAAVSAVTAPLAFGRSRSTWLLCAGGVAAVAGLYGFGLQNLAQPVPQPNADGVTVRVVQADVRQEAKYDADKFQDIVFRYLRLTASAAANGRTPDIVIWPEGAIPAAANDVLSPASWTYDAIASALKPGQILLMGGYRADQRAVRPTYYNSLFAIRREAAGLKILGIYDKYRLVPFGEYMPAEPLMNAIGFKKMTHVADDGFTAGPQPQPLSVPGVPRVQPLICYESLFPGFVSEGAKRSGQRASWIVNISNDAWFGRTSGPWQHLNLASYRAIEEGLPIVRATPTGVSAVIDAHGRPQRILGQGQAGVIDSVLPGALPTTSYGRYGETFLLLMIGLSGASILARARRD